MWHIYACSDLTQRERGYGVFVNSCVETLTICTSQLSWIGTAASRELNCPLLTQHTFLAILIQAMIANLFSMHEQNTNSIGTAGYLRALSACLPVIVLLTTGSVALAESYADLPETDKAYVKRLCAPVQYQQDTAAYRNCIEQHSIAIQKSNRTPVASLDFDEQLSVQKTCQKEGAIGSILYRQCVVVQARSLEGISIADTSSISDDRIYEAREGCANKTSGVKAYRLCVNKAVQSTLATLGLADVGPEQPFEATTIKSEALEAATVEISSTEPAPVDTPITEIEATAIKPEALEAAAVEISSTEPALVDAPMTEFKVTGTKPQALEAAAVEISSTEPAQVDVPMSELAAVKTETIEPLSGVETTLAVNTAGDNIHNKSDDSIDIPLTSSAIRVDYPNIASSYTPTTLRNAASELNTAQNPVQSAQLTETLPPELSAAESVANNAQGAAPDAQQSADTDDLDPINANKPALEVAKDYAQKLWAQLQTSLEGVEGRDRTILLAALALPFLLIGFWLIMRRRSDDSDDYEEYSQPHSRAMAGQGHDNHSMHDDTADAFSDTLNNKQLYYADQVEELFADDEDPVFVDTDTPAYADDTSQQDHFADDISSQDNLNGAPLEESEHTAKVSASSDLMTILTKHEREEQLGFVIEFMIYWMAFTDERYEPELKRKIFAEQEPDDHDLIKRSVLSHDLIAFTEAVSWLQSKASLEERQQVLKLLMALLVYEEGITPVQNTLLRFLCNAFGLTHIQLDEMFQIAFGQPLPPMPRPDKPSWWNKQSSDKLKRWDARSVAQQTPSIQARVKLGLPLSGELDPQQITEQHERAILRCQADNFGLLTNREQQLAERQQAKYHNALEVLMEVSE